MGKRRVALITESTARKDEPTPAYLFYQGPYNKWVNAIIKYQLIREFPTEDAFFLSYANYKIYGFEEKISWYEKTPDPNSKQRKEFAEIIINFLNEKYRKEEIIVELHLSKGKFDKLIDLLEKHGYEYRIFGADVSLGEKPSVYEELIMELTKYQRLRDLKNEKYNIIQLIPKKTPNEAKEILDRYNSRASIHGVEDIFEELKRSIKDHWQAKKAVDKAKEEALQYIHLENNAELETFFKSKDTISSLFENISLFEKLNKICGKTMAKIERYLIKTEYLLQKEQRISSILLKLQINLMKN